MLTPESQKTENTIRWSSSLAFILTATGTAVGLGNIWRFTFVAGENGGGLFVFFYLLTVLLVALPIMIAELVAGRRGRGSPTQVVTRLIKESRTGNAWMVIGVLSVFIPYIGIAYYSVVSGWIIDYLVIFAGSGGFEGGGDQMTARFDGLMASPVRLLFWHALFMAMVTLIVSRGLQSGVEMAAKIIMPALFIMLIGLVIYAAFAGDFARAVAFLFKPDFSKMSSQIIVLAVGQAFFSLAIGIGALMTFGSYLDEKTSLPKAAGLIAFADTLVAILAGLAIFPLVFSNNLAANEGPGLIFITLPTAFAQMPGGYFIGTAFFVLLFFAALTTGIGTMEPVVAWLTKKNISRSLAALLVGVSAWFIGAIVALSFNLLGAVHPLTFLKGFKEMGIFEVTDFLIASVLLPVNGLFIVLFVGWAIPKAVIETEFHHVGRLFNTWRFFIRFVAPIAIMVILISSLSAL